MIIKSIVISLCITVPLISSVQTVIFAAGKSTRLESKLLKTINGKPILYYPLQAAAQVNFEMPTILVLGHQREKILAAVHEFFPNQTFDIAIQEEQLGTGHALQCTQQLWKADHILVLNGDHPLTTTDILRNLIQSHEQTNAQISLIITKPTQPCSWGRIVQDKESIRIVEAIDFKDNPQEHPFVNAGYYIFTRTFLQEHINKLQRHENKNEFYVTDLIEIANRHGMKINCVHAPFNHVFGINTQQEFNYAEQLLQQKS